MAIKLGTLAKPAKTQSSYTYQDLHLDLEFAYSTNNQLWRGNTIKDIKGDIDLAAIRNSLTNIFTTVPGQKILNPLLGLNLMQFLFEECTETVALQIGNTIYSGLSRFEPRVQVTAIQVLADPGNQQFVINMTIAIPRFNVKDLKLVGNLSTSGFYFVNS